VMRLAWPRGRVPSGIKVILRATFTTLDGQAFSAETEVTLASAARPAKPPAAAGKSK